MAANHPELIKAASQIVAVDKHAARIRSEGKEFEKALVQAMAKEGSEGVSTVMEGLPTLRKELTGLLASLKPPLHHYATLGTDKAFMDAHRHDIAPHIHHLVMLNTSSKRWGRS